MFTQLCNIHIWIVNHNRVVLQLANNNFVKLNSVSTKSITITTSTCTDSSNNNLLKSFFAFKLWPKHNDIRTLNKIKYLNRTHQVRIRIGEPIFALSGPHHHSLLVWKLLVLIAPHCSHQMSLALSSHTTVQLRRSWTSEKINYFSTI